MDLFTTTNIIAYGDTMISTLLRGNHGIGKSAVTYQLRKQVAERFEVDISEVGFVDTRIAGNEVGDVKGMPFVYQGRTYYSPPAWVPLDREDERELARKYEAATGNKYEATHTEEYGILFLDELPQGSDDVLNWAFQVILDHRVDDGLRIAKNWIVVAAGNFEQKIYSTASLNPALLDRFRVIDFSLTVTDWLNWAREDGLSSKKIHPLVLKYIEQKPEALDPSMEELVQVSRINRVERSRRSWEFLSRDMYQHEARGVEMVKQRGFFQSLASTIVGVSTAANFVAFCCENHKILDPGTIIDSLPKEYKEELKEYREDENIMASADVVSRVFAELQKRVKDDGDYMLSAKQFDNLDWFICNLLEESAARFFGLFSAGSETPSTRPIALKWMAGAKTRKTRTEDGKDMVTLIEGIIFKKPSAQPVAMQVA